jgi:two-component system CheB/CheR fusion protein
MDVLRPQSRASLVENLVEFAPDALFVVDAAGRIVLANRTAETLFGYGRDELLNAAIEQLIPERFRAVHTGHRLEYANRPRTREMGAGVTTLVALRRDGAEFPVEIRLAPIDVSDERLFAAAVRDVTDRRHAAEALRAAEDKAVRANAAKGRFLATASHDLRQPVQTLRLLNAALQRQMPDAQAQQILTRERDALDSMARLLNALLDISKLDSGSVLPEIEVVGLAELFDSLREEHEPAAAARGLALTVSAAPHHIRTDRMLLRQLLDNLISNAIKYTDVGSVRLDCAADDGGITITVSDTGVGLAPDHVELIFDEFYQVDRKSGRHGVGLGLAIVKRIATLLGLTLEVKSELGQGARFSVRVSPALIARETVIQPTAAMSVESSRIASSATILLVEDDDAVRDATELFLRTMGHTTIAVSSIAEVDEFVAGGDKLPDLIISDYHLGRTETGLDVVNHVRAKSARLIPALLVSGDTSAAMRQLDKISSCLVLSKPVDIDELTRALSDLLPQHPPEDLHRPG